MRSNSLCALGLCLSLILSTAASSELSKSVTLVTNDDYFPYAHESVPGGGWSKAIVEAVFDEMGIDTETHKLPWSRGLMWTGQGKYLGTYPYIYSAERAESFYYSVPINRVPVKLYVSRTSGITDPEHLHGKSLCLPHGYSKAGVYAYLTERWNMVMHRAQDGVGCFLQVEKGWSDAGLTNGYLSEPNNLARFDMDSSLAILPIELDSEALHFLISKDYPNASVWVARFNNALDKITETGKRARIDAHYQQWLSR
ncbi:transporter substrate-binding domain-containing protein [Lacimicrobium sp. SS2-24]|uniref:substrate-binding periplasmic protein n=1 Tax=Lacimicrobium sp. SS2-24 TaxID=2005569 RepID=UPI000B4BCF91|nr:transporter substrate-binding domain-containing protein [Lacimicrobium sp. SS2-24]